MPARSAAAGQRGEEAILFLTAHACLRSCQVSSVSDQLPLNEARQFLRFDSFNCPICEAHSHPTLIWLQPELKLEPLLEGTPTVVL